MADGKATVTVQPKGLPMGYTLSCSIFTRLTRALTTMWRARGYQLVHLLDDFSFMADTYEECCEIREAVVADLCLQEAACKSAAIGGSPNA